MHDPSELQPNRLWEAADSLSSVTHRAGTFSSDVLKKIILLLTNKDILSVETGCGKSTILLSNVARHHTVFCYDDRTMAGSSVDFVMSNPYFVADRTTFVFGPTQHTLPRHQFPEGLLFDLALIDGPHGFPFPDMEFWHLYPRLAPGALLVIDDLTIPSISRMYDILREDRMFDEVAVFSSTGVLRRSRAEMLPPDGDHWWEQAYNYRRFPLSMKQYHRDIGVDLDAELDFSSDDVAERYCVRGFDRCGRDGARTIDTSALIRVRLPTNGLTRIKMAVRLRLETAGAGIGAGIFVNDDPVAGLPTDTGEHEITASFPVSASGDYSIDLRFPDVKHAHDTRANYDFRRYGCTVRSLKFEEAKPHANAVTGVRKLQADGIADHTVKTAAQMRGTSPDDGQNAAGRKFNAALARLAEGLDTEPVSSSVATEIIPAPVLCPRPDSPVRFMPLGARSAAPVVEGLGPFYRDDNCWTFVDFAVFEGAEFAYAVYRSLLHRIPSKRKIKIAQSRSAEMKLLLLLEADRKARRIGAPSRLAGLPGTRMLYLAWRTSRKLKIVPLTMTLRALIRIRARLLFANNFETIVQRRMTLAILDRLSANKQARTNE